jgi:hypothetical protein
MCLIIYSPKGALPTREAFWNANANNSDGIGVMSAHGGIHKFLRKKQTSRAWDYVQTIANQGKPFAVHFRWATHGEVCDALAHPFPLGTTGAYLMHNGVLQGYGSLTDNTMSDTSEFCADVLRNGIPEPGERWHAEYMRLLADAVGGYNKLCIMHASGAFELVNEASGAWIDGLWYSNKHSIEKPVRRGQSLLGYSGAENVGHYNPQTGRTVWTYSGTTNQVADKPDNCSMCGQRLIGGERVAGMCGACISSFDAGYTPTFRDRACESCLQTLFDNEETYCGDCLSYLAKYDMLPSEGSQEKLSVHSK